MEKQNRTDKRTTAIEIIRAIVWEKRAKKIIPAHALRLEISRRYAGTAEALNKELADLTNTGIVTSCDTINDKGYTIL